MTDFLVIGNTFFSIMYVKSIEYRDGTYHVVLDGGSYYTCKELRFVDHTAIRTMCVTPY